jgi:rhodanese-related sulfurtransferase
VVAIDGSLRTPRQGTFEFLQIPRVVVLDQLGEEDRGIGVSLTEVEEITNSVPPPTAVAAPSDNGRQIPADADAQGFVGYPGKRCSYTNPAVAIARTADSVVVICQTGVRRFYYKGFGLQNGFSRDRRPGADGSRFPFRRDERGG